MGGEGVDRILHGHLAQASELHSVSQKVESNIIFAGQNRYSILHIMLDRKQELLAKINLSIVEHGMTPALRASKSDIESSIRRIEIDIVRLVGR